MKHDPIPYNGAPGHRGVETSIEASDALASVTGRLRVIAYNAIKEASNGLTNDELAAVTGFDRSSIQPRTSELKLMGRIKDSKQRRKNANGKRAIVWVALSDEERAELVRDLPAFVAEQGGANG